MAGAAVCSGGCTATGRLEDEYELAPAPGILNHATIQVLWISDTGQTSHSRKSKARSGGVTLGRGEDGDLACVAHYSDDETVFSLKGAPIPPTHTCVSQFGIMQDLREAQGTMQIQRCECTGGVQRSLRGWCCQWGVPCQALRDMSTEFNCRALKR